jgi:hypothetical protein
MPSNDELSGRCDGAGAASFDKVGRAARRKANAKVHEQFAPIKIRLLSRACEADDHESCKHPKCECECHE